MDRILHLDRLRQLLDDIVDQLPEEQARAFENTDGMLDGYMR